MGGERHMGYVFDLDGTLVDSVPTLLRVINTVLERHSLPKTDREENISVAGWGLKAMFERTAAMRTSDPELVLVLVDEMLDLYRRDPVTGTIGYPGAREFLEKLNLRGDSIGIITNKLSEPTMRILESAFPEVEFTKIYAPDAGWAPKPSSAGLYDFRRRYSPDHLVFVGDTELDYHTAIDVADEIRLATWGYRGRRRLLDEGFPEDMLIDDFEELD